MRCQVHCDVRTTAVLTAATLTFVFIGTTVYSSGMIYVTLLDKFGQGEPRTALVGALSNGFQCFSAPIGGIIVQRFSSRTAIVTGAIITSTAFASSVFVPTLDWMILTAGVLVGTGNGIMLSGTSYVLGCYVKTHRDLVLSAQFLVTCIGMFLSTPVSIYIIERLGINGLFYIFAGMHAQICVFGVLAKPNATENRLHKRQIQDKQRSNGCVQTLQSHLNLSLLKNIPFVSFLLSTTAWNFALIICFTDIPNYVVVLGRSSDDIEKVMTALTAAVVTGRALGVVTVSKYGSKGIHIHIIVIALSGILTTTSPLYSSEVGLFVFTIQLGVFLGCCNSMMVVLCLSFVGLSNLAEAHVFCYFFCGIGTASGPVVTGYVYSLTGSYEYSFIVAGVILLLGSMLGLTSLCLRKQYTTEHTGESTTDAKGGLNEPFMDEDREM